MKIKRIKYKNYRCFLDAEVVFETTKSKNIALLVGPNGSGKTEMLFSFGGYFMILILVNLVERLKRLIH